MSTTFISRESLKVPDGGWGPTRDGNSPEAAFGWSRVPLSPETVEAIAADLRRGIQGEVRFDPGSCALYSTDASNYRQVPYGVVIPKSVDDVIATMAIARKHGAPVLSRGGGTSLAGQCCNVAVVIDWTKYLHHVLDIDPDRKLGRVEPGCILDHLRDEANRFGLTFGPDPATHTHNTLGGMIGNDSCGVHSVMAVKEGRGARTADNVESLEVLTYDGTRMTVGRTSEEELERIIREGGRKGEIYAKMKALRDRYADEIRRCYPKIPRRVSGYNLDSLLPENGFNVARALVGSEGTLVAVLNATLDLVHNPKARTLLVLGYPDVYSAGDHVPEAMGFHPIACEGLDDGLVRDMIAARIHPGDEDLLPPGKGWLMLEFGGESQDEADDCARQCMEALKKKAEAPSMKLYDDKEQERQLWLVREAGLASTARTRNGRDTWPGWEDSAVPPDKVGAYLRDLRGLFNRYGYGCDLYGHFGQGCIHVRVDFDLKSQPGIEKFKAFLSDAADLVVHYGGALSGEHGDGQGRAWLLPKMFGENLVQAFREFKSIWDPDWKMNPGKVVDPFQPDSNLRLGTAYNPPQPKTYFQYPDDDGSFSRAVLRCVGVGQCRRMDGGTMCPSFMVTREEEYSTRGRSRMLFEMLQGEVIAGDWHNDDVKDALDLCLACKGCLGDCPMHVDMATYKAEFLSHYYDGRARPRTAYTMGLIMYWARLAELFPGLANFLTHAPGLSAVSKWIAGIAQPRTVPAFAPQTFKSWFRERPVVNENGMRVILWPDTFNNHFHPETAKAAVEVLEAAGCRVIVPHQFLCCGRPLYDWGMLAHAQRLAQDILHALREEIRGGTPVVGLEPSCTAVFRDELVKLYPHDEDAGRLSRQTFTLAEFLTGRLDGYKPPKLAQKALVHGHCHHKAVMKMEAEEKLLDAMGLDYTIPEDGCCGMAGAFGFEAGDHYDVSVKCGERKIRPLVRDADDGTLIVADGFSCREQIHQGTDRRALHLAQLLRMAIAGRHEDRGKPEDGIVPDREADAAKAARKALVVGAALAAAAGLAWAARRSKA